MGRYSKILAALRAFVLKVVQAFFLFIVRYTTICIGSVVMINDRLSQSV